MLVHDLRSPLGAVIGGLSVAEELLETPEQLDAGMLNETVNLALDGSRHLLDLINSILDINKLESGSMPLQLQPVALAPLAEDVVRTLTGTAEITGVKLSSEVPADLPPAQADRDKVHRVVMTGGQRAQVHAVRQSVTLRAPGRQQTSLRGRRRGRASAHYARACLKFVRCRAAGREGRSLPDLHRVSSGSGIWVDYCQKAGVYVYAAGGG
jgi:K+-sensing histidine kinase KdpD